MQINLHVLFSSNFFLIGQSQLITILIFAAVFFGILLLIGIRKSYLLEKENQELKTSKNESFSETDKSYSNFSKDWKSQQQ